MLNITAAFRLLTLLLKTIYFLISFLSSWPLLIFFYYRSSLVLPLDIGVAQAVIELPSLSLIFLYDPIYSHSSGYCYIKCYISGCLDEWIDE